MASIQSILAGLVPKDLVNQKNLDDALAKIREMLALLGKAALPDLTAGGKAGVKSNGTSDGLSGKKSAAQLAQEEALADFFKKKLAEEAAAAAAALAAAGRGIDEEGITGQVIEHIAAGSDIDAILEYADAATARANAIASLLEGNNAAGMEALTTNALANAAYGFQSFQTAEAAAFLPTGNGSVGGGIGAFDRDINITVNTGVGDPNAIAEAIENLLREANSRGTLTSGLLNIA
jgi:nucleotide-binding universal stress UspA family protein